MPRWPIVRTLLYKELLRYRYNWGVLVLAGALLALSALISVGARFKKLPGQEEIVIQECHVLYEPGTPAEAWAQHLAAHPPEPEFVVKTQPWKFIGNPPRMQPSWMAIQLVPPDSPSPSMGGVSWTARYWFPGDDLRGALPFRDWFSRESQDFIGSSPRLLEENRTDARVYDIGIRMAGAMPEERVPLIVTALAIFALYLFSFNLYISSTGEEREKRMLLGLLLSPASPLEILAAKAIFYATASLFLSLAVVAMYRPILLLQPLLWGGLLFGSLAYTAIGTVMICIVRRQTTMNTIPMLYLIATSMVMFLAQFLPPFVGIRMFLIEDWLYRQLQQVILGEKPDWLLLNQAVLMVMAIGWCLVALRIFRKQGMLIGRAR